jgi:hypothetical protein
MDGKKIFTDNVKINKHPNTKYKQMWTGHNEGKGETSPWNCESLKPYSGV